MLDFLIVYSNCILSLQTTNAPCTVTLKGVQDGKALTHSMTFDILKSDDVTVSAAVHHLATKAQIKLLEDQEEEFVAFRMSFLCFP
jgi:hypothetical protein